jgi:hypothetical protein
MAGEYLTFANFRLATVDPACIGIELTVAQITDANLTAVIAEMSSSWDKWTDDHFFAEVAALVYVDGEGRDRLYLPKRCRTVTKVETLSADGSTWTTQTSNYRLVSSLNAAGTDFARESDEDFLVIDPPLMLAGTRNGRVWPDGKRNIRVTGDWSWLTTPAQAKRAVALMCWERVQETGGYMRTADTVQVDGALVNIPNDYPSQVSEVINIARVYSRCAVAVG